MGQVLSNPFVQVPVAIVVLFLARFLYKLKTSPNRTTLIVFFDTLLEIPVSLKLSIFATEPDVLNAVQYAMRKTKLSDFGYGDEGLKEMVNSYALVRTVACRKMKIKMSPMGNAIIRNTLAERMCERLKLIDYVKRHPTIKEVKLKAPIFVTGLTRTGTTFLHEKLGLHEAVRMHYTWEQLSSTPTTDDESLEMQELDRQARYKAKKGIFDFSFKYLVSEKLQYIHRIAYDEPEECTVPCANGLPWALSELPLHIIAADELFANLSAKRGYEMYKLWLQMMTWQTPGRRGEDFTWMLKCPFHLPYLSELTAAFPGATIVWTHRDPADCIASACSLYETLLKMGYEETSVDKVALGKAVMRYSRVLIDRALQFIEKHEKTVNIVHIRYTDNVKKSHEVCEKIFTAAGIPITENFTNQLNNYLDVNAKKRKQMSEKKGQSEVMHDYTPEEYGLTRESIRAEFKDYIDRFDL